ncbi:MAG: hypothetical protein R2754_07185 [Microthrixaceae bacterium]
MSDDAWDDPEVDAFVDEILGNAPVAGDDVGAVPDDIGTVIAESGVDVEAIFPPIDVVDGLNARFDDLMPDPEHATGEQLDQALMLVDEALVECAQLKQLARSALFSSVESDLTRRIRDEKAGVFRVRSDVQSRRKRAADSEAEAMPRSQRSGGFVEDFGGDDINTSRAGATADVLRVQEEAQSAINDIYRDLAAKRRASAETRLQKWHELHFPRRFS